MKRNQRSNCQHQLNHRKSKEIKKYLSTSASLATLKPLTVWITTNCGKILKEMGIADHFTCLLRNLYAGQKATVRTRGETIDWFKIGKGIQQNSILLFNFICRVSTSCETPG